MDWLEISVHTTTIASDLVSELLMSEGALGTQVLDRRDILTSQKKDGMWDMLDEHILDNMPEDVVVQAYYSIENHAEETLMLIKEKLSFLKGQDIGFDLGSLKIDTQKVQEQDWAENWKKYYKPTRVGNHLVICPSWEKYNPQPEDLVIHMDPGMAFGTGTHETTSMCMDQLEYFVKRGQKCIDVGCGSGILALAAARLGAGDVLAIDLDADAVKVARENVVKNGLEGTVRTIHGDLLEKSDEKADVIVANIIADVICYLCGPAKAHLNENGVFICSGIIRDREADVKNALEVNGYQIVRRLEKGEWVCLAARQK